MDSLLDFCRVSVVASVVGSYRAKVSPLRFVPLRENRAAAGLSTDQLRILATKTKPKTPACSEAFSPCTPY